MASDLDPEGVESRALLSAVSLAGARVLEIGSGDGRLAFRYADVSSTVVAIELERQPITAALDICPPLLRRHVRFVQGNALALPFRRGAFDIAVLAWSL